MSNSQGQKTSTTLLDKQRVPRHNHANLTDAVRETPHEEHAVIRPEVTHVLEAPMERRPASPLTPEQEPEVIDLTAVEQGIQTLAVDAGDRGVDQVIVLDTPQVDLPRRPRR